MAKKKKGRKSRKSRSRKSKGGRTKSPGVLVELGTLGTVYQAAIRNSFGGQDTVSYVIKSPDPVGTKVKTVGTIVKANLKRTDTFVPLVVGVLGHWGKNKPIVGIVGRPLDKMSKRYLHRPL